MKITVERNALAPALAWVTRNAPSRPTNPALAGVLVTADATSVTFQVTDLETSALRTIAAAVENPAKALVGARVLADVVRNLPDGPVALEFSESSVAVRGGKAKFALPLLDPAQFPAFPEVEGGSGEVDAAALAKAVAQVSVATAKESPVPVLTSVRIEVATDKLTLVATDRYRLAVTTVAFKGTEDVASVSVPRAALLDVVKAMTGKVKLASGEGTLVSFAGDANTLVTRQIAGEFPAWRRLLPEESSTIVRVEAKQLAEALKRAALVAPPTAPVKVRFCEEGIEIAAGDNAGIGSVNETVDARFEGNEITTAFNPTYLLDGVCAIDGEITIKLNEASKPALLTGDGLTYMVMPVRV